MEIWKEAKGYEGIYEVSNYGNIKRLERTVLQQGTIPAHIRKDKILKPQKGRDGYLSVNLYLSLKMKRMNIHRIVALAFLPNPEDKPQVNHINGIKTDNRVENLEWNTRSENQLHSRRTGLQIALKGEKSPNSKLKDSEVLEIRNSSLSCTLLSNKFNVGRTTISRIKNRTRWAHL